MQITKYYKINFNNHAQVEVDAGDYVPDFTDSVLIHRSVVEELNSQIKVLEY